ncbi:MAG TPA: hypothetical protein VNN62_15945 [Methylomirabilota bacterium]|jgi:hypothetical protein|nr:hypothetical protein [Methylomirabilota bacterium]
MDSQTLIVLTLIIAAALYVGRTLWPAYKTQPGCSMCPRSRNRADDYV